MIQVALTNVQLHFFEQYIASLKNQGFKHSNIVVDNKGNTNRFISLERGKTQLFYCKNCINAIPLQDHGSHQCLVLSLDEL